MSHHSTPALALAAALALTGVSVPALAASPQPGGVLPANPDPGRLAAEARSRARASRTPLLSIRQAEARGSDPARRLPLRRRRTDDTPTTIIVQLEEGAAGGSAPATRDEVKARIASAVQAAVPGAQVTTVRDYTNALDGFAIEAPGSALSAIQKTQGVKVAFIEGVHKPLKTSADGAGAPVLKNASSLAMTRAAEAAQKGDRQVIEVIDSGLQTDHDAFAGSMDGVDVRLSEALMFRPSRATSPHGSSGTYVNSKIPFAYDYADNDADVVPHSEKDLSHGTHVTAIAAANADVLQGTAPHAQIVAAKVASDADGSMPDSALLAALDDALVIKPDVINLSLGDDAGMSSDAGSVFAGVYEALTNAGITVNAASGNAFSNAYGNNSGQNKPFATDPDTGTLGEPASYKSTLAVASVDNQEALSYVTLGDRKIAYRTALDGQGEAVRGLRDIPEKSYRVVDAGAGGGDEARQVRGHQPTEPC